MSDQYMEYVKLHMLSLEQDMQKLESEDIVPYRQLEAAWSTAAHLLAVYSDIKYNGRES
jgi:hypothetical protein